MASRMQASMNFTKLKARSIASVNYEMIMKYTKWDLLGTTMFHSFHGSILAHSLHCHPLVYAVEVTMNYTPIYTTGHGTHIRW